MGLAHDLYSEQVTRCIEVPSSRTMFIAMREDMRLSWLQFTFRQPPPAPQYSHQPTPPGHGYQFPMN